jgi:hypothetical protein
MITSPSISRMIKSRRMRWAEHAARMRAKRNVYRPLVGKPEGTRPLEEQDVSDSNVKMNPKDVRETNVKINLTLVKRQVGVVWT